MGSNDMEKLMPISPLGTFVVGNKVLSLILTARQDGGRAHQSVSEICDF